MATYNCASDALNAYSGAGYSVSSCLLSLAPHFTGGNGCLSGVPAPAPSYSALGFGPGTYSDFRINTSGTTGIAFNFFRNGTFSVSHLNSTFNNTTGDWIAPKSSTVGDNWTFRAVYQRTNFSQSVISSSVPSLIEGSLSSTKQLNVTMFSGISAGTSAFLDVDYDFQFIDSSGIIRSATGINILLTLAAI